MKLWEHKLKKFGKTQNLYCIEHNGVKNVFLKNEKNWLGAIVETNKE